MIRASLAISIVCASSIAHADFLNHDLLRAHVATMDAPIPTKDELDTSRIAFAASALIPGFGTFRLERRVFGSVRPAGIVGDLILGGIVPAGLLATSFAVDGDARSGMRWTALGLYAVTRISILVIGNLHITAYRDALALRFHF